MIDLVALLPPATTQPDLFDAFERAALQWPLGCGARGRAGKL